MNETREDKLKRVLSLIEDYGWIDGSFHKQWVFDQIVRVIVPDYDKWVKDYNHGEDGPDTYCWDEGIAP